MPTHNIKDDVGEGKILGIDVSIWFHKIIHHIDEVREFHIEPPVPITSFLADFKVLHENLRALGVEPFYVFDGMRHPMKSGEDAERRIKAREQLSKLYREGHADDFEGIEKLQREAVEMRPDMIALVKSFLENEKVRFIQAPAEADAQLAALYEDGFINEVVSEDGDIVAYDSI